MSLSTIKKYLDTNVGWHTAGDIAIAIGEPAPATRVDLRTLLDRKEVKVDEPPGVIALYASRATAAPAIRGPSSAMAASAASLSAAAKPVSIDVAKLLAAAKALPEKLTAGPGIDYVEVVHTLRAKHYSYKQCHEWLLANDVRVTISGMTDSYKKWAKTQPGYKPAKFGPKRKAAANA